MVQVLAGTKISLRNTQGQDVTHIETVIRGMLLQVPVLPHGGLKLRPGRLRYRAFDLAFLQKAPQEVGQTSRSWSSDPRR